MFNNLPSIDLSFDLDPAKVESVPTLQETQAKLETTKVETKETTKETTETETKEEISEESNLDFDLGTPTEIDFEPDTVTEEVDVEVNLIVDTLNDLADSVFSGTLQPYEGYDPEEKPSKEMLQKFVTHNIELAKETAVDDFYSNLSSVAQRIVDVDLNAENEEDVRKYLSSLIEETNIKALDPNNEFDQERIVRQWFENEDWTPEEVEEKLSDLKNSGLLAKEASRIKPKLESKAEEIATKKEESMRQLREMEQSRKKGFLQKVGDVLKGGKIGDIPVNKDEATKIFTLLDPDKRMYQTNDGKKLEMTPIEMLIMSHRYSQKADPETLAMVAYLLTDREGFEKKFKKVMETKATNEFVKDHKYQTNVQAGRIKVEEKKGEVKPVANKWQLKI